jgi:hypothetical protein
MLCTVESAQPPPAASILILVIAEVLDHNPALNVANAPCSIGFTTPSTHCKIYLLNLHN